ncbi:MAG: HipA domain-containing protein, partial [Gammaproteobacteria bacterium]
TYLGVEDFCVLNALRSNGRYEGSYEGVAKRIRDFVSPEQVSPALEQLFATVAFCCAIENGDAHLKNFAVVYENAESIVSLAPAYDLVCTTFYESQDCLALTLDDSKSFPTSRALAAFALRHCDLPAAKVKKILQRISGSMDRARSEIRDYIERHADFARAGEHLIGRFEHGLHRLELI